jgi:hypothetical protein
MPKRFPSTRAKSKVHRHGCKPRSSIRNLGCPAKIRVLLASCRIQNSRNQVCIIIALRDAISKSYTANPSLNLPGILLFPFSLKQFSLFPCKIECCRCRDKQEWLRSVVKSSKKGATPPWLQSPYGLPSQDTGTVSLMLAPELKKNNARIIISCILYVVRNI